MMKICQLIKLPVISLLLFSSLLGCAPDKKKPLVIGSKNFTEQVILGELLAQYIEKESDIPVDRRLNLGGTFVCHQALVAKQLDLYVEYTGTAFTAIMKEKPISDPKEVFNRVKKYYAENFDLAWTPALGFNNTFAILIRGEDAKKFNLTTISQAAKYTPKWQAGFGYEFLERKDGFQGLSDTYGLKFAGPPKTMDLGLVYRALDQKKVDLVAGNSTDGLIDSLGLFSLQDDKQYFPPYEAAPVVNNTTLKQYPQLEKMLNDLGGKISESDMRKLNYKVDGEKRDVKEVVKEFLDNLDKTPTKK